MDNTIIEFKINNLEKKVDNLQNENHVLKESLDSLACRTEELERSVTKLQHKLIIDRINAAESGIKI
ncbi:hypothetical protein [Bacillus multifaciens]|uniref:hypothetical protein n=1 Tax=Bacillus multifaciens TaxID=3068506 RepID=UPI002741E5FD|nr:hypothetical protein [Bacillus sp. WLY-B-L8]MDP7979134.1 hypothetical protein [Bacillus sp. WLY-B-L8]